MSEFGKAFRKLHDLSQVDTKGFSPQELSDHKSEIIKIRDLGMKLLDEIEARQSKL